MKKCPHCDNFKSLAKVKDFGQTMAWINNPIGLILNSVCIAYHDLNKHTSTAQYKCESCGGYSIECGGYSIGGAGWGGCGKLTALSARLWQNATFHCPKCGKKGRAVID